MYISRILWSLCSLLFIVYPSANGNEYVSVEEFRLLQQSFQGVVLRLENKNVDLASQIQRMTNKIKKLENKSCDCANYQEHKRLLEPKVQSGEHVVFSTRLTHAVTGLGNHQIVAFNKVVTDTSSSYNANDGIFSAPQTGMYVFTWTIGVKALHYIGTELVIDNVLYGYAYADGAADGDADYGSSTQTVAVKVQEGQQVWIRRAGGSGSIDGINNKAMDSTFSGWMLYPLST